MIKLKKSALVTEGLVFTILGALAIVLPNIAGVSITILVGVITLVAGCVQCLRVLQNRHTSAFWLSLIAAILAIIIGVLLLASPTRGVALLTLLLGVWFLVHGVIQVTLAIQAKGHSNNWAVLLISGIASLVLAIIIYAGWPFNASWVLGLLLGINLLFFGVSLLFVSAQIKS